MPTDYTVRKRKIRNISAVLLILALIIAIVWLDLATSLWQQAVILSGIAAGILTFLLTALFLERWMDKRESERWRPVTRVALTDLLYAVADEERSDLHRGHVVPREIAAPDALTPQNLANLLEDVIRERERISASLAKWAGFLAASGDVQVLMIHVATIAESLDRLRDTGVELENSAQVTETESTKLGTELAEYSATNQRIVDELENQLYPEGTMSGIRS